MYSISEVMRNADAVSGKQYRRIYSDRNIVRLLMVGGPYVTYGWCVHGTLNDEKRILTADNDKIQ